MAASVYHINKGINKPIEFKGLKAQYIAYLAVGLVVLLILFAALYIMGVNMFVCLGLTGLLGTVLVVMIQGLSNRYGQYGLLKRIARSSIPSNIKSSSRRVFLNLNSSDNGRRNSD